ncbi:hypothetical protein ALI22I_07485 [Saccharothrix sp. ALI-22-I]|uniref:hypothetical protein n=1 Tax=Saccharothrix sp. ALI-22-I TaxID=1933778 RepID=UPI0009CE6946|nr:hypothetical protein [Saccharothrix sp. ALI-22-I]ONI91706.1 hypothetical protein ALI22I_07485 [Saccharothrix sp. ALI-22-I]
MAAVALVPLLTTPAQAAVANVTVDFGAVVRPVPRDAFSADITGYGSGSYITNDPQHRAMLAGRYGSLRMELKYTTPGDPTSAIIAGGSGAETKVAGDAWITAIKDLGAEPVLIVPDDATDAANLVRHFNLGGNRIGRWIIGNEPDTKPNGTAAVFGARFNAVYDAMKAVDPSISVGGPAVSHPNMTYIREFLTVSGTRADFVDFHKYGAGEKPVCDTTLLAETAQWSTDVAAVRDIITSVVPARANQIGIQIGETNSDWGIHPNPAGCGNIGTEPVQYRNAAIWWSASVFGRLAEAGARGYAYGDKNGALGLLYDQPNASGAGRNERMPVYQGIGFFTGQEGTALAHFGSSLVRSSTTLGNVEVYASANPKVIVVVNKGMTPYNAVIGVGSGLTQAAVHQKDGNTVSYAKPANLGTVAVSAGQVTVGLPGPSVTQLVLS